MKIYNKLHQVSINLKHTTNTSSPHFTFLIKRNNIICFGVNNTVKTHPLANQFGHRFNSIHSELACINNFQYPISQLNKFDMVNVRITSDNKLAMSKPCNQCIRMLRSFGVHEVVYSTKHGFKRFQL